MAELKTCLRCEKQNKITAPKCEWCGFDLSATEKPTGIDAIAVGRQEPIYYFILSGAFLFCAMPFGAVALILTIMGTAAQRAKDLHKAEKYFRAADMTFLSAVILIGISMVGLVLFMVFAQAGETPPL